MRRHDDARVMPEGVAGGQRLGAEHIEYGGRELAAAKRIEKILLDQMPATGGVDQRGAFRQHRESSRVQYFGRLVGKRQQADEDLAAAEQRRQSGTTVEPEQPLDAPRTPSP